MHIILPCVEISLVSLVLDTNFWRCFPFWEHLARLDMATSTCGDLGTTFLVRKQQNEKETFSEIWDHSRFMICVDFRSISLVTEQSQLSHVVFLFGVAAATYLIRSGGWRLLRASSAQQVSRLVIHSPLYSRQRASSSSRNAEHDRLQSEIASDSPFKPLHLRVFVMPRWKRALF